MKIPIRERIRLRWRRAAPWAAFATLWLVVGLAAGNTLLYVYSLVLATQAYYQIFPPTGEGLRAYAADVFAGKIKTDEEDK